MPLYLCMDTLFPDLYSSFFSQPSRAQRGGGPQWANRWQRTCLVLLLFMATWHGKTYPTHNILIHLTTSTLPSSSSLLGPGTCGTNRHRHPRFWLFVSVCLVNDAVGKSWCPGLIALLEPCGPISALMSQAYWHYSRHTSLLVVSAPIMALVDCDRWGRFQ